MSATSNSSLVIAATKTNRMCTHCCGKPLPACLMVVINIMQGCVILRNMIVEDENKLVRVFLNLNENASATIVLPPEVRTSDNSKPFFAEVLRMIPLSKHGQHIDNLEMI